MIADLAREVERHLTTERAVQIPYVVKLEQNAADQWPCALQS